MYYTHKNLFSIRNVEFCEQNSSTTQSNEVVCGRQGNRANEVVEEKSTLCSRHNNNMVISFSMTFAKIETANTDMCWI